MYAQADIDGVRVDCPLYVGENMEFTCNASVSQGSFVSVSADYNDGQTDAFKISGKVTRLLVDVSAIIHPHSLSSICYR